jgi:hypothetical protein
VRHAHTVLVASHDAPEDFARPAAMQPKASTAKFQESQGATRGPTGFPPLRGAFVLEGEGCLMGRLARMTPLQIDPNSTSTKRNIESFASRMVGNGARIRNLRETRSRNQVSVLILVHTISMSQAGVGDDFRSPSDAVWNSYLGGRGHHDGGTKVDTGPAESQSVYYRSMIENPLSLALLGEIGFRGVGVTKLYGYFRKPLTERHTEQYLEAGRRPKSGPPGPNL